MEEFRKLKIFKKYFWDYKLEKISEKTFTQRIVDLWPILVKDFENKELNKKTFLKILKLIDKNFENLIFRYSIIKDILEELNTKIRREQNGN